MNRILLSVVGLVFGWAASSAHADYIGINAAMGYNVFVLGNFTQSGTDSGAGVAVGGNFAPENGGSFTVHGDVVVGGNYTNGGATVDGTVYGYSDVKFSNETVGGKVYAGHDVTINGGSQPDVTYARNATLPSYFYNNPSRIHQVPSSTIPNPVDFSAAGASLKAESDHLHGLSQTASATVALVGNDLQLHGGSAGHGAAFYEFHITATELRTMGQFHLSVFGTASAPNPTVVIDVTNDGTAYQFANIAQNISGTTQQYVLYNFASATSNETINTHGIGLLGSMLAPNATVNFDSGNINGTMIAGNLYGGGETHAYMFLGNANLPNPTAVPAPSSLVLLGIGALSGRLLARRKRHRRTVQERSPEPC
jgi:choice-of-anchor A domain-containing protein